jgi:flagellar biosynthesis/type III secretory pathway protein FliH
MSQAAAKRLDHNDILKLVHDADTAFRTGADLPFSQEEKPAFRPRSIFANPDEIAPKPEQPPEAEAAPSMADAPLSDAPDAPQQAALTEPEHQPMAEAPTEGFTPSSPITEIDEDAIRAQAMDEARAALQAEIDAAREEGRRDGLQEARETAEAELSEAREAFLKAAKALEDQMDSASGDLKGQLKEAIRTLAAQRAGQAIDAMPLPFTVRIMKLAERVSQAAGRAILQLHPDDIKAIKKHIEGSALPESLGLRPDEELSRGDVILHLGELSIADVLDPKYSMEKG